MKNLIILCVLLAFQGLNSQNAKQDSGTWGIKAVYHRGIILQHHSSMAALIKGFPANYEVNLCKTTNGSKRWHIENNFPVIGISAQCMDYAYPQVLGRAYTAVPFIEIPLNKIPSAKRLHLRIAWGAAYLTKCYNAETNHSNFVIGSHLNSFVQFRWFWKLPIGKYLQFEPGISFSHASNGKARAPNLGLNVFSINAGLHYQLLQKPAALPIDSSFYHPPANRWEELITASYGVHQQKVRSAITSVVQVGFSLQRRIRNTHTFSLGTDLYKDENYKTDYIKLKGEVPSAVDALRLSLRVGYAYNIGNISMPIEIGAYVFQKVNPDALLVTRLGLRYFTKSGVMFSFGLRTHYAVAYTFEYGLGYCFRQ